MLLNIDIYITFYKNKLIDIDKIVIISSWFEKKIDWNFFAIFLICTC